MELTRLPVLWKGTCFDVSLAFSKAILRLDFDVIHSHGYRDFLTLQSSVTSRIRKRPFVLQPHGSLLAYTHILERNKWRPYVSFDALTLKRIAKKADAVVVSTTQEAEEARKFGVEEQKIWIIPTGASIPDNRDKKCHDTPRLLFVGRISPSRKVHQVIEALAGISQERDVELTIVGGEEKRSHLEDSGYLTYLVELAAKLGLRDKVRFTGPLYGSDLDETYEKSDIFVYISSYENFGQTILEAASNGLPVISTPIGVARDIVIDGETGNLVEIDNVGQLRRVLRELIENPDRVCTMGLHMQEIVQRHYAWADVIERYRSLYDSLLLGDSR